MKKLYLSNTDKKISGVLGGLSEYFEVDSTLVRVLFIFILIMTGFIPGILFYIIVTLVIPKKLQFKLQHIQMKLLKKICFKLFT